MEKSEFYRSARHDLAGPLDGVRVLDVTTTWAGPMCSCILGDLGADVIKVESPQGDISRRLPPSIPGTNPPVGVPHATVNRNKRNIVLDLKRPEGRALFLKAVRRTDILVENFRPGTMDRWGIGYRSVAEVKPDIIYVSISGSGQFGVNYNRPGYDPITEAEAGFMALNGSPEGEPVRAATWLGDDLAGLHGAIAALAALRHRDRTGEGQHVDVSMLDAMLAQSNGNLTSGVLGLEIRRWGSETEVATPANVYRCRDGEVYAGALLDSHWKLLARVIGRPDLAEDPAFATFPERAARRAECNAIMAEWFATQTVGGAIEQLDRAGLPCAPVRTYAETAADPHVRARDMLQSIEQQDGTMVPITGPAAKFSRTPTRVRFGAAALGGHTDEILEELGVNAAERRRLREDGVV